MHEHKHMWFCSDVAAPTGDVESAVLGDGTKHGRCECCLRTLSARQHALRRLQRPPEWIAYNTHAWTEAPCTAVAPWKSSECEAGSGHSEWVSRSVCAHRKMRTRTVTVTKHRLSGTHSAP
eukprot:6174998-Pleurochrysis_carterae.AAC.3